MAIETISIKDAADVTKNVLADLIGSDYAQMLKLTFGDDGTMTLVTSSVGLPVSLLAGSNSIGTVVLGAGADTIGSVDLNPGANTIGNVGIVSMPAAAAATDSISAKLATDKIMNDVAPLTPKFAKANVSASSTDANIVTAVGGKKIRPVEVRLSGTAAVSVTFNSKPGGAGTAISELFTTQANAPTCPCPFSAVGHFETATGEGLTVTTGSGGTTGIGIVYLEV